MVAAPAATAAITDILLQVVDPEIPEISIVDLGIVRDVALGPGRAVEVKITPTYSGCPAYATICADIEAALTKAGYAPVTITRVLAPAWSTDWLSAKARATLRAIGIAPPGAAPAGPRPINFVSTVTVPCPRCGSHDTELVSEFGATACKALRRCRACQEPFEHVKPI